MDKKVGRLAFREEGTNWNAYYAFMETMEGAIFLGSIRLCAVQNSRRRSAFVELMKDTVSDAIEEITGIAPEWGPEHAAPEHDKAGHA